MSEGEESDFCPHCQSNLPEEEGNSNIEECTGDICMKRYHEACAAKIWFGSEYFQLSSNICLSDLMDSDSKSKKYRIINTYPFLCRHHRIRTSRSKSCKEKKAQTVYYRM